MEQHCKPPIATATATATATTAAVRGARSIVQVRDIDAGFIHRECNAAAATRAPNRITGHDVSPREPLSCFGSLPCHRRAARLGRGGLVVRDRAAVGWWGVGGLVG